MTIETAFFICAFGGLFLGGLFGSFLDKRAERKRIKKRTYREKMRRNQLTTFSEAARYDPEANQNSKIGY